MEPMTGDAMTHLTAGAAVVYFLQWAKKSNLPILSVISHDTVMLNRIVSIIAAAALAFGINWTGDAAAGWVIHVPPVSVLIDGAWEFAKQFTAQQMIYDTVTKRPVVTMMTPTAPVVTHVAPPPTLPPAA